LFEIEPEYGLDGYTGILDQELAALDLLIDGQGRGRGGERYVTSGPLPPPDVLAIPDTPRPAEQLVRWQTRVLMPRPAARAGRAPWSRCGAGLGGLRAVWIRGTRLCHLAVARLVRRISKTCRHVHPRALSARLCGGARACGRQGPERENRERENRERKDREGREREGRKQELLEQEDGDIAGIIGSASRWIWFSSTRADPLPLRLHWALPDVTWEKVALVPIPQAQIHGSIRVPLERWHPMQIATWPRLEGPTLPEGLVLGVDAAALPALVPALGARLAPTQRMLLVGRPQPAGIAGWRLRRRLAPDLWLLQGPPVIGGNPAEAADDVARHGKPCHDAPKPVPGPRRPRRWPRISVVTISYNQVPFLEATLHSVLDQAYPNLEYIVIDGGSTDASREILERHRKDLAALIIEPDKGQSDALRKGFSLATGDILTWLCSDDLLEPGALTRVADAFERYGTDLVAGGCRLIDAGGEHIYLHHNGLPFDQPVPLSFGDLVGYLGVWKLALYFFQPEVFFSRNIWEASGAFIKPHLHFAMDYDLFLRFAMAGARIVHIPHTLAASRVHRAQKTRHDDMQYLPTVRLILREYRSLMRALATKPPT